MPVIATSLLEAVTLTGDRVGRGNLVNLLKFYIEEFNLLWAPSFDKNNVNDRTVRNWFVSSKVVEANTPVQGNAQQRQAVVDVAVRILYATNAAFSAGRITATQRDDVLSAWNNSFGLLP